jgi:chromosome partitioning protein
VLLYASEVFVPASMDYLSLVGIKQVFEMIDTTTRTFHQAASVTMIIPTFYDRRLRKSHEVMDILNRHFADRIAPPIRHNVRLSEAPSYQEHIYEYDPKSIGAQDYGRLVKKVLNGHG